MSILDTLRLKLGFVNVPATETPGHSSAPGAVEPLAHLGVEPPKAMTAVDFTGGDFDHVAARPAPPSSARTWRAPITSPDPATNANVSLSDREHTAAGAHLSPGAPDPQRGRNAGGMSLRPDLDPMPEHPTNVRRPVVVNLEPAPVRPRQGFTGEDPARAAGYQVVTFVRPFDQAIAHHPGSVPKAGQANPLAARPPERKRLIGGRPSASGSSPTGMEPVGLQPNTVRTVPGPWDNKLTNPGVETQTSTQRVAWRAR